MERTTLKRLLTAEFTVIALLFLWIVWDIKYNSDRVELLREASPDGGYVITIGEIGKPVLPIYPTHIRVNLYSHEHSYAVVFRTDVATKDGTVDYGIEWLEDGVLVILSGEKTQYYILPFKTQEDSRKLL